MKIVYISLLALLPAIIITAYQIARDTHRDLKKDFKPVDRFSDPDEHLFQ